MKDNIKSLVDQLIEQTQNLELDEKIEQLNEIRWALHEISPFVKEPTDCVLWIKGDRVKANGYNPNVVATPEMRLLNTSINLDGFTQPIVSCDMKNGTWEVVDGFHRNRVGKENKKICERLKGYLPITNLDKPLEERMAATIRHNRARGTHQIRPMSDIVLDLTKMGWSDEEICKNLGMELDEVIRLKQITGLKEAFQNHEFSKSWEEFESRNYGEGKDSE